VGIHPQVDVGAFRDGLSISELRSLSRDPKREIPGNDFEKVNGKTSRGISRRSSLF
jgi:hypothetical protein